MQKVNYLYRLIGFLAAALLAVCCLPMTALAADKIDFTVEYLAEDDHVVGTQGDLSAVPDQEGLVVLRTKDNPNVLGLNPPSGFELGIIPDKFSITDKETISIHVKRIRVNFTLEYLDENDKKVSTQTGLNAPVDKDLLVDMTTLPYELPAGYEMGINSDKFFIEDGDTVVVHVKRIHVTFTLQYRDEDNRILGTQKDVSAPIDAEGKVDLAALSLTLPEGCTLVDPLGKLAVKNGDIVVLPVKAPATPKTVTVNYWDVENKTAAGTGRITVDKDATQVDTALLTDVPAGYELVTRGNAPIVDGQLFVEVKSLPAPPVDDGRVVMNIQFKDGETTVLGGDFRVPAGVQKYSVLNEYVPKGYILTQTGDFTAAADAKLTVSVRKYPGAVPVNVRFMDGDKVVGEGKYNLPEGVQKYSVLEPHLPAGYKLDKTGDFTVTEGLYLELPVSKITPDVILNIRFMDGKTFVAGGDYTLSEGVHSYADLTRHLPKGYAMDVTGDFMAKAGAALEVPVHKLAADPPAGNKPGNKPGSKPADNKPAAAKPADKPADSGKDTKAAQVVKPNVPAANASKIIPKTGLTLKSPVLLGVMLTAALAAAALYLFVIRKKLN